MPASGAPIRIVMSAAAVSVDGSASLCEATPTTGRKPAWERLRKSHAAFQLNRLELEKDEKAGPALTRMREILAAKSPYKLIKEVDALIGVVDAINSSLLAERRAQAITKIDGYVKTLNTDLATANADVGLRATCLKPLESLRSQVEKQESLAHITQAETEAVKEFVGGQGPVTTASSLIGRNRGPTSTMSIGTCEICLALKVLIMAGAPKR
jgi:hypothetical protein